jgi:arylsulfatase A-like enzyme
LGIEATDRGVAALLDRLGSASGARHATLVVLAPRGPTGDAADESTLSISTTHVPLWIRLPGGAAAQSIDRIVELIDVAPTLLELTGSAVPKEMQGASLLPLIHGAGQPPYIAFGESPHVGGEQFAALGGYRLVLSKQDDRARLFHLETDPGETEDLAATESRRVEVLREHLGAWEKMAAVSSLDPDRRIEDLDDATLEQLKSLGYVQ